MKKHLLLHICCFAIGGTAFAQSDESFHLHLVYPTAVDAEIKESYTDGDSITNEYFKKCAIKLLSNGKDVWKKPGDLFLTSYEIKLYDKKGEEVPNKSPGSWTGTTYKAAGMPEKIIIDDIQGTKTVDGKKVVVSIPSITIYKARGPKNAKTPVEEEFQRKN